MSRIVSVAGSGLKLEFARDIVDITMTQIEAIVEPERIADDVSRKSVTSIGIHPRFYQYGAFKLAMPKNIRNRRCLDLECLLRRFRSISPSLLNIQGRLKAHL